MVDITEQVRGEFWDFARKGQIEGCESECKRKYQEYLSAWRDDPHPFDDRFALMMMNGKAEIGKKLFDMLEMNADEKQLALYDLLADFTFYITEVAQKSHNTDNYLGYGGRDE
jgi:hypothetical protein